MSASPEPRNSSPHKSAEASPDRRENSRGREDSRDRRDGSRGRDGSRDRGRNAKKGSGETSTTSLLVRNLSFRVTANDIRDMMEKYGKVRDVYIPRDHYTKQPKGFCFVEFFDGRDAR
jgi:RNA recognition motif-containing protein